jgi:hypothetical protein
MIRLKLLAATAIVSSVFANPALAQAVIQEPGVYAKNFPDADLGIGYLPSSHGAIATANAKTTIGQLLPAFMPTECANYFENAGYAST